MNLWVILALAVLVAAIGLSVYRAGKRSERARNMEVAHEDANQAARIRDAVDSDHDFRDRLHDRFEG